VTGLFDEIRIVLHMLWTRRWIALAVAWGVCILGWLFVSQIPSRYESHARVFVQMRQVLPAPTAPRRSAIRCAISIPCGRH